MEFEAAKQKVYEFINNRFDSDDDELVICSERIIKTDFGWIFPYDSKKYLETEELIHAPLGNPPIIFDNRDETIHRTGSSHGVDYYIDLHRKNYIPNS